MPDSEVQVNPEDLSALLSAKITQIAQRELNLTAASRTIKAKDSKIDKIQSGICEKCKKKQIDIGA